MRSSFSISDHTELKQWIASLRSSSLDRRAAALKLSSVTVLSNPSFRMCPFRRVEGSPDGDASRLRPEAPQGFVAVARVLFLACSFSPGPYSELMSLEGVYEPSPSDWVRNQVAEYESSGGKKEHPAGYGLPVVIVTTRGNKSGKIRKTPLMRVEHDGEYALVASQGGAPTNPVWYYNLVADPTAVVIQDGPEPFDAVVRQVNGEEKVAWWDTGRRGLPSVCRLPSGHDAAIPVFVASKARPALRRTAWSNMTFGRPVESFRSLFGSSAPEAPSGLDKRISMPSHAIYIHWGFESQADALEWDLTIHADPGSAVGGSGSVQRIRRRLGVLPRAADQRQSSRNRTRHRQGTDLLHLVVVRRIQRAHRARRVPRARHPRGHVHGHSAPL